MNLSRNLVDSSGWIEYFTGGPNTDFFAPAIEDVEQLVVASLSVLEVFRWILREHGETAALRAIALMQQGEMHDLDTSLALQTAKLGLEHKLPLADSVILATARKCEATVWTQDADFKGIPGVEYRPKRQARRKP